jgi:hypothetical protein
MANRFPLKKIAKDSGKSFAEAISRYPQWKSPVVREVRVEPNKRLAHQETDFISAKSLRCESVIFREARVDEVMP